MIQLTQDNFDVEVINSEVPVIVDFYTDWCNPCRGMIPILNSLQEKYNDKIKIIKVNSDMFPSLVSTYEILSVPTLLIFNKGQRLHRLVGSQPQSIIESLLEPLL